MMHSPQGEGAFGHRAPYGIFSANAHGVLEYHMHERLTPVEPVDPPPARQPPPAPNPPALPVPSPAAVEGILEMPKGGVVSGKRYRLVDTAGSGG